MTSCWIVTDGKIGTENQCLGVADALGITATVKRIGLRPPWSWLAPYLGFEQSWSFCGDSLAEPYPELLIAAGRKAIAAARYIKRRSGGRCFTVQLQDPRAAYRHFDLIALPAHDPARGDNIMVTDAAPNRITAERLERAQAQFATLLNALPGPRVAVLIGGNSKAHQASPEAIEALIGLLSPLSASHSLLITTSRRTGEENTARLREKLNDERIWFWDGSGDNPYHALLAGADYILVTEDSVSMVSEAASTGKPVYTLPMPGGSPRFTRFYDHLLAKGVIRRFAGTLAPYDYTPLNDAAAVAAEIKRRMAYKE